METKIVVADFEEWRESVKEAVALLGAGEVVALPTETVYGLGADVFNSEAVAKVFEVKERPSFDPLIVHVGRVEDLGKVAEVPEELEEVVAALTQKFWPGPLTLILPKKAEVSDLVTSGLPTVAVRLSAHEVMREVAKKLGPVAAPSANRFGRISPTSARAVEEELGGRIPLIIDGGACRDGLESTIVAPQIGKKGVELRLLRPGPVTREELRDFGKVIVVKKKAGEGVEAPGQVESHYAPGCPVLLFDKPEDFQPEAGKRYGLLSYRGEERDGYLGRHDWAATEILSPGSGKLAEAAVRFFYALRELDRTGVDAIVAEPVSETGLGRALMDRLRRASAAKG
ncbi:MAG: L-threonylcarbamoyladenylate synthase [Verrucomicrobiales bacterium]